VQQILLAQKGPRSFRARLLLRRADDELAAGASVLDARNLPIRTTRGFAPPMPCSGG
jgi:hypothetical protein